jgi:hypothetical protein
MSSKSWPSPQVDELLQNVSLVVADLIHNARSALDHFAWQLACAHSNGQPTNPRSVHFPVCTGYRAGNPHHQTPQFISRADWDRLHEWQPCKGVNGDLMDGVAHTFTS